MEPIKSIPYTLSGRLFQFFMISFFLTISLIPLEENKQGFIFCWGNALTSLSLYGHPVAFDCKSEESLADQLFFALYKFLLPL